MDESTSQTVGIAWATTEVNAVLAASRSSQTSTRLTTVREDVLSRAAVM